MDILGFKAHLKAHAPIPTASSRHLLMLSAVVSVQMLRSF